MFVFGVLALNYLIGPHCPGSTDPEHRKNGGVSHPISRVEAIIAVSYFQNSASSEAVPPDTCMRSCSFRRNYRRARRQREKGSGGLYAS